MHSLSNTSRLLLLLAATCIALSLFFPIWRIELDAPQYPEGLSLLIFHNKLGGNVDIINGLNHYIGMKTLHAEEFVEFSILRYIIIFFVLLAMVVAYLKSKKWLLMLLIIFSVFGTLAMYDFWRWEYEYGHNLDPTAAIIVPGMAYQPPLIGFKQLLNFGAYSIPDIGGWSMLVGGLLILGVYLFESGIMRASLKSKKTVLLVIPICLTLLSCSNGGSDPIVLNKDVCSSCKMTISNGHFGCEFITVKGKVFKFDDVTCMFQYLDNNFAQKPKAIYINYFLGENELIPAEQAYYLKSDLIKSPMGGNIVAFKSKEEAKKITNQLDKNIMDWTALYINK
jgi:copper chaperone NosL